LPEPTLVPLPFPGLASKLELEPWLEPEPEPLPLPFPVVHGDLGFLRACANNEPDADLVNDPDGPLDGVGMVIGNSAVSDAEVVLRADAGTATAGSGIETGTATVLLLGLMDVSGPIGDTWSTQTSATGLLDTCT
jgi:hypothetical protein